MSSSDTCTSFNGARQRWMTSQLWPSSSIWPNDMGNYADLLQAEQEQGQMTTPKVGPASLPLQKGEPPRQTQTVQKHVSTEPRKRGTEEVSSEGFHFDMTGKASQKYTLALHLL